MAKGACYLFLGPEIGEKNDAIAQIRDRIKKEAGGEIEESSFYAGEMALPDMVAALLTGSLFSAARLFFIKNAELITKKAECESLGAYIKAPQDDTTLILLSDSNKIETSIEKLFGAQTKKIFYEMFAENKERWVTVFFRKEGFGIEKEAVQAILEMVENNTAALRQECARIALFLKTEEPGTKTVSEALILKLLGSSKQVTAFALFSALATGDALKSFDITHNLLLGGEAPQMIFAALASSFRKYREYCLLLRTVPSPSDFDLKKIGVNFFNKKDFGAARRVYGDNADASLALIAEYDILTRGNYALAEVLMDMFVYKILAMRRA